MAKLQMHLSMPTQNPAILLVLVLLFMGTHQGPLFLGIVSFSHICCMVSQTKHWISSPK
uniref:Uncharacterized protein n=1 Tax=Arundo donax TaxID=35708 RepID=A0A0A9HN52_ARUDO